MHFFLEQSRTLKTDLGQIFQLLAFRFKFNDKLHAKDSEITRRDSTLDRSSGAWSKTHNEFVTNNLLVRKKKYLDRNFFVCRESV